jgi:hypothetical protein
MAHFNRLLLSAACLLPALCSAQSKLDGSWAVSFSTRDDETRQALVTIAGAAGTWTTLPQPGKEKRDPCVGRPFALTVMAAEPQRVLLEVAFAKQMPGCKDRTVTGEWVDASTVEGKLDNGKPVRMVRK